MLNNKKNKIYLLGIGGVGMTPLALLLKQNGYFVSGVDIKQSNNTQKLKELGISIDHTHSTANIHVFDIIVYSSAIKKDSPEIKAAKVLGKKLMHRSEVLAFFVAKKKSITITGTHGKTTTSSLLDHILNFKTNSTVSILGGTSFSSKNLYDLDQAEVFVAEADESDGSFLNYKPTVAVITNIEEDHLDYYKNYSNIIDHFKRHLENIKPDGIIVYNYDDLTCRNLTNCTNKEKVSYGLNLDADVCAQSITQTEDGSSFELKIKSKVVNVSTKLLGKHNILNILGATAAAFAAGKCIEDIADAIPHFKGVKRRLELVLDNNAIKIFDDYAHNPGKITASLQTLKKHFPNSYLITIFQPHRFSRLETMHKSLLSSFNNSDLILVCPVFKAGETLNNDFTPEKIAKDIQTFCHKSAKAVYNIKEILKNIPLDIRQQIVISTIGAGDVGKIAYEIREHLQCSYSLLNKVS